MRTPIAQRSFKTLRTDPIAQPGCHLLLMERARMLHCCHLLPLERASMLRCCHLLLLLLPPHPCSSCSALVLSVAWLRLLAQLFLKARVAAALPLTHHFHGLLPAAGALNYLSKLCCRGINFAIAHHCAPAQAEIIHRLRTQLPLSSPTKYRTLPYSFRAPDFRNI